MCVYVAARPTTNGSAIGSSHLWGRERPPANEQDSIEMRVVLFSDGRYNSSGFGRWESGLGSAHRRIQNISRFRAPGVMLSSDAPKRHLRPTKTPLRAYTVGGDVLARWRKVFEFRCPHTAPLDPEGTHLTNVPRLFAVNSDTQLATFNAGGLGCGLLLVHLVPGVSSY